MKFYINDIEQYEDYFLVDIYNAGATMQDIKEMLDGYTFTGKDGNMYNITED